QDTQLHFVDDAALGVNRERQERQPDSHDPGDRSSLTPTFWSPPLQPNRRVTLAKNHPIAKEFRRLIGALS
ncbi:MAG TPA: hypothetical protein VNG52_06900, partial [Stellaceae bacterium]|nr:hypothetical protein [Stellaceae bacterium]